VEISLHQLRRHSFGLARPLFHIQAEAASHQELQRVVIKSSLKKGELICISPVETVVNIMGVQDDPEDSPW